MDGLRLSLLIIGSVIVGAVYLLGKMLERSHTVRAATRRVASEVEFEKTSTPAPATRAPEALTVPIEPDTKMPSQPRAVTSTVRVTKRIQPAATTRAPVTTRPAVQVAVRAPELIVALTLMARDRQQFKGTEIDAALRAAGLELAEFDIYHFRDADADERAVFSVANIVKPGSFDIQTLHELSTPGLAMFMQIPGPLTASAAFDAMLEKAHFIVQCLHGIIGDEQRTPLSPQRMRALREHTLKYDFAHAVQDGDSAAQSSQREG